MEEGLQRAGQPGVMKSFVHGVGVSARAVRPQSVARVEVTLPVSVGAFFGGLITLCVASPTDFVLNTGSEVGLGLMSASVGGWAGYGAYRGARAAGRHFVAKGRADLARTSAPARGSLTE